METTNIDKLAARGLPFVFGRSGKTEQPTEIIDEGLGIYKWGKKNLYPQWLNGLFYQSAVHSGIIRSKVFYTTSGGLSYEGTDQELWTRMFENGTNEANLDELATQMSLDLEIFEGIALRGRWSADRSFCSRLDLIPFETARQMVENDNLAVCPDWSDTNKQFIVYKPLDVNDRKDFQFYIMYKPKDRQSITDGQKKVTMGIYPIAPYSGGVKSIQTDIEIVNYQHSEIINNFAMGTILNLNNGKPKLDEDRIKLERRIRDASGTDAAGGTIVLYNNGKDNAATVTRLNGNDLNDRYNSLGKDVRGNIVLSHSVTSLELFALGKEGSFNATNMEVGYNIMKANYFQVQQRIIESMLMDIAVKCNGMTGEIAFNDVELQTTQLEVGTADNQISEALGKMSPLVANSVLKELTINEIRAIGSAPAIEGGDRTRADAIAEAAAPPITEFSKENDSKIFEGLKKIGIDKSGKNILYSLSADLDDLQGGELAFMEAYKQETFVIEDQNLINILSLIAKEEDFDAIAEAVNENPSDLAKIYETLEDGGYLDDGKITEKGILEVALNDAEKLSILYSYEVRPDAPNLLPGGESREFCANLIQLDRLYTREEIDSLSNDMGLDVWRYKGGWYHDPNRDVNVPFCRHEWQQNIVFV